MAAKYKAGDKVQQVAAPYRTGRIRAVRGSGADARITVSFPGWHPVTLTPAQIEHV